MKRLLFILLPFFIACSSNQDITMISGSLVGSDGKPMVLAHVQLIRINQQKSLSTVKVAQDGSFQITTNETGLVFIQFSGVDHESYAAPLLIESPKHVKINCSLQRNSFLEEFGTVKIMGDFNNFSFESAKDLEEQPDGTFSAEFESDEELFRYQLFGIAGMRFVNGTQSDDYEYDGIGDYRSVVNVENGKVKIVFDPEKLIHTDSKAVVEFEEADNRSARFAKLYDEMDQRMTVYQEAYMKHRKTGVDMDEFSYDWSEALAELSDQVASENDPFLQQVLIFNYTSIGLYGAKGLDETLVNRAMDEIPPSFPLYSIQPYIIQMYRRFTHDENKYEKYVESILIQHEDASVKAMVLYNEFMVATMTGDPEKAQKYYEELTSKYPESQYAQTLKTQFPQEKNIKVGKNVPNFSVVSLDHPEVIYSNENLKGQYYLIDFWATWCGPCLSEMGNLHETYERFKQNNFEIISLSFDQTPDVVRDFRRNRWQMPWLHAFIEGGFNGAISRDFDVTGIPKPILVNPNGKIIALGVDLRGRNLERTLSNILMLQQIISDP